VNIKYSVIIPTRNGLSYLPYAIKSVLSSERDDIELIISNNHSNDGTCEYLSEVTDPRFRVVSPPTLLPMSAHYEFAISQANGDWITILGDDDAVMPYIFERLDVYIDEYVSIDIISSERAYYYWPGCEDLYGAQVVSYQSGRNHKFRSTRFDLFLVLAGLRSCFDMPQIYTTSIVKRKLYEEIKEKSGGCFYHSIIPDMYSVVALCLSRKQYLRIEDPLFWVGTSNKSMSRSDRIYLDAIRSDKVNNVDISCVPQAISDQVPYLLHCSAFGAVYVYECLLMSPLGLGYPIESYIRILVLASVLVELDNRSEIDKDKLIALIKKECKAYKVPFALIACIGIILRGISLSNSLFNKAVSAICWFMHLKGRIKLFSNNREKFNTIIHASNEVSNLRSVCHRVRE
jgi:glycosyltransferase involved in cell wall biosynthesis